MAADSVDSLRTLADVRRFVAEGCRASADPSSGRNLGHPLEFGFAWGELPLAVAEPGPLIEHAVKLAATNGLTLQELRDLFSQLGADRLDRGLVFARGTGLIVERHEKRPNRAGKMQEQVVLYEGGDA